MLPHILTLVFLSAGAGGALLAFGFKTSTLIRLDDPLALCLDGSPGGYYFRPAASAAARGKWYIHHEGGGWCQMEKPYQSWPNDNCLNRSKGYLGTLRQDNSTKVFDLGYESPDQAVNPLMYDWNQVYIRYCDGGTFSGRLHDAVRVNNTDIHFKGGFILEAVVKDLQARYGTAFDEGTDFVIGGSSAGGLAVYLHIDFWRSMLPSEATVVGLPDSGFFLDWTISRPTQAKHSYDADLRWGFKHMNYSAGVNSRCIEARRSAGGDTSDCAFAQHTLPFIQTPIFILQSPFDSWQLQWEHGEGRTPNYTALNAYGTELTAQLKLASAGQNHGQIGGFIDHCYHHCTTADLWSKSPQIKGLTESTAFAQWYKALRGKRTSLVGNHSRSHNTLFWQYGSLPCTACGCPSGTEGPKEADDALVFV